MGGERQWHPSRNLAHSLIFYSSAHTSFIRGSCHAGRSLCRDHQNSFWPLPLSRWPPAPLTSPPPRILIPLRTTSYPRAQASKYRQGRFLTLDKHSCSHTISWPYHSLSFPRTVAALNLYFHQSRSHSLLFIWCHLETETPFLLNITSHYAFILPHSLIPTAHGARGSWIQPLTVITFTS